jgi:hypothetical protein
MKSMLRHIGDTGQDVSKPSASRFMFSRVSATRLGGLNTGRRVTAAFDLRPPALKALIRRHELICGARCCVVDTIVDKRRVWQVSGIVPFRRMISGFRLSGCCNHGEAGQ